MQGSRPIWHQTWLVLAAVLSLWPPHAWAALECDETVSDMFIQEGDNGSGSRLNFTFAVHTSAQNQRVSDEVYVQFRVRGIWTAPGTVVLNEAAARDEETLCLRASLVAAPTGVRLTHSNTNDRGDRFGYWKMEVVPDMGFGCSLTLVEDSKGQSGTPFVDSGAVVEDDGTITRVADWWLGQGTITTTSERPATSGETDRDILIGDLTCSQAPTSLEPTAAPTSVQPTAGPTVAPSAALTTAPPTLAPTITTHTPTITGGSFPPTGNPTYATAAPTPQPPHTPTPTLITHTPTTTAAPTMAPPTGAPTSLAPTRAPTTHTPTTTGSSFPPMASPTFATAPPTTPTSVTASPTLAPTASPSTRPTDHPTTAMPTTTSPTATVPPPLSPPPPPPVLSPSLPLPPPSPSPPLPPGFVTVAGFRVRLYFSQLQAKSIEDGSFLAAFSAAMNTASGLRVRRRALLSSTQVQVYLYDYQEGDGRVTTVTDTSPLTTEQAQTLRAELQGCTSSLYANTALMAYGLMACTPGGTLVEQGNFAVDPASTTTTPTPTMLTTTPAPTASAAKDATTNSSSGEGGSSTMVIVGSVVAVALCVCGGGAYWWFRRKKQTKAPPAIGERSQQISEIRLDVENPIYSHTRHRSDNEDALLAINVDTEDGDDRYKELLAKFARQFSRKGSYIAEQAINEQKMVILRTIVGKLELFRRRYRLEKSMDYQGASGIVTFANDELHAHGGPRMRKALKFFLDPREYEVEVEACKRIQCDYVLTMEDIVPPNLAAPESSIERYGCIVYERGEYTLQQFLQKKKGRLENMQKQVIIHQLIKGLEYLHNKLGLVHNDIKPQNLVKFSEDDVWKVIDLACSCDNDSKGPVQFTLRYGAPEVVAAAMDNVNDDSYVRQCAADMWSAGVLMYELYTNKPLFNENMAKEEIAATLCSQKELPLKGLNNIDPNAARFIRKLLVKDPHERWTAEKCLQAKFFMHHDDTTTTYHRHQDLHKNIQVLHNKMNQMIDLQSTAITNMEVGDIVIEINLLEVASGSKKLRQVVLTEHDDAGQTFHLVHDTKYHMVVNILREGQKLSNPVKRILALHVTAEEDGRELALELTQEVPRIKQQTRPLPNCVSVAALWDPRDCGSERLLSKTKWPQYRFAKVDLELELSSLPGQSVTISPSLYFEVHRKDTYKLKGARVKNWAADEYMKLSPGTRAMIMGAVTTLKVGTALVADLL